MFFACVHVHGEFCSFELKEHYMLQHIEKTQDFFFLNTVSQSLLLSLHVMIFFFYCIFLTHIAQTFAKFLVNI